MVLNDKTITRLATESRMIEPFVDRQVRLRENTVTMPDPVISYGLTSYGYDARIGRKFRHFSPINNAIADPKAFDPACYIEMEADNCIIPPHSFVLGHTVEYFRIPRDILVLCIGKSTFARCGLDIMVTPLEPEWEGHVTIEISNNSPCPARIYAGEGICQFVFLRAEETCEVSYADRRGKYQGSVGIVDPKA